MEQAFQARHLHHVWSRWKVHRVYSPGVKCAPEIIVPSNISFLPNTEPLPVMRKHGIAACSQFQFVKELSMKSLREMMTEDMQVRNLSPHTQTSYVQQVSLFARHLHFC